MVLQQQQSDWDFFKLLLHRQGWLFALQQKKQHWQLIVVERSAQFKPFFPCHALHYHTNCRVLRSTCRVAQLHAYFKVSPHCVNVYDYQVQHSDRVRVYARKLSATPGGAQHYFYGLGLGDAQQVTRFLDHYQTAVASDAQQFCVQADALALAPGHSITLQGHPVALFNGVCCVVQVFYHYAPAAGLSHVRLKLARVAYQPRCALSFAAPGYQLATIDGLSSQAADLTATGDYHMRYPNVPSPAGSPYASAAVRLNSLNTGLGFGWHYPLLKNTQIIYANLNAHLHYPIIISALPSQALIKTRQASQQLIKTCAGHQLLFHQQATSSRMTLATADNKNALHIDAARAQQKIALRCAGTFYGVGQQGINIYCQGNYQQSTGDKCAWQIKNSYYCAVNNGSVAIDAGHMLRFYAQGNVQVAARQLGCNARHVQLSNRGALNIALQTGSAYFNAQQMIAMKAQQISCHTRRAVVLQCSGARLELRADGSVLLQAATINVFGRQTQVAGYQPKP